MALSIFISCGEESGDLHGSSLMASLRKLDPGISVKGMGGKRMLQAGLDGIDSSEISVVGIVEVVEKLPKILGALKSLRERLSKERPGCLVLIDFPDFNLKVAKEAKRLGIPVVYYISPQVWAWRRGRLKKIAGLVDRMLVVFPFEEDIYRETGVDVEYVGHPLADVVKCGLTGEEARGRLGLDAKDTVVALLPGSRTGEVARLLPPMLGAAEIIHRELEKGVKFLLPAAGSVTDGFLGAILKGSPVAVKVVRGEMYNVLRASDAAIVTSGTATLETALIGTPMVIVYRMSPLSYVAAKALVGVKHIGLPNIVAGRAVVPELIQGEATPGNMAREVLSVLRDKGRRGEVLKGYDEIRGRLGAGGAADRAASSILRLIKSHSGNA